MRIEDSSEDTELNLTPMIDVVFQLIVFFLLTLKFKDVDRRIDSNLPKGPGIEVIPVDLDPVQTVRVKVFRRHLEGAAAERYTLLKVDDAAQLALPKGWRGHAAESAARRSAYRAAMARLEAVIRTRQEALGHAEISGEIVAPPPKGGSVPHGDVVAVLDAFLRAGITDVRFEGAAEPLTRRERAARE